MANPFATRATEFVRNVEAFLSMVSPDPVVHFLAPVADDDGLFRRLVTIQGTPGSGKTTIAKLFEFSALAALMRGEHLEGYSDLISALQRCHAFGGGKIRILACRLPLESDYQEVWQLPYSDKIKTDLLQRLIQSRTVLAWFAQLERGGVLPDSVSLVARDNCDDLLTFVGGAHGESVLQRARAVEAAVYRVIGSLIPSAEQQIEGEFREPFRLFDSLESIRIESSVAEQVQCCELLWPVVILDDAHYLHSTQLQLLHQSLIRREMKIGRWILSRLDVLQPAEVFSSFQEKDAANVPGITRGRDVIPINLQGLKRSEGRRAFRAMARQMTTKYLRQMDIFRDSDVTSLDKLLPDRIDPLPRSDVTKLEESVRSTAARLRISSDRVAELEQTVENYSKEQGNLTEDMKLAMVRILLNRYAKRVPQQALLLDEEPSRPLKADADVEAGAGIHLLHEFDRPYYVGFDAICDAASENAEMYLQLASRIVENAENHLVKQKPPTIPAREQNRLLRDRAKQIISDWNFPEYRSVRAIVKWIAERCLRRTREPNAPLASGANAFGVPWKQFLEIGTTHPDLANLLKYAVAYNAISLIPEYECKHEEWCLLELGGVVIVHYGLTLKRGGFVEGTLDQLVEAMEKNV